MKDISQQHIMILGGFEASELIVISLELWQIYSAHTGLPLSLWQGAT